MWDWFNENSSAITAVGAIIMVVVTAVYAFFTVLLWRATRRQAEAGHEQAGLAHQQAELTRTIFEATHRPEVSVDPVIKQAAHPGHVRLNFKLTNHGRLTAIIRKWSAILMRGDATLSEAEPITGTIAVFPGASSEAVSYIEVRGSAAAPLWKSPATVHPATLYIEVLYQGTSVTTYTTKVRATLWMTDAWAFALEDVEHEIS